MLLALPPLRGFGFDSGHRHPVTDLAFSLEFNRSPEPPESLLVRFFEGIYKRNIAKQIHKLSFHTDIFRIANNWKSGTVVYFPRYRLVRFYNVAQTCYECMVRRATAREKCGREDKSAQMYSAFGWRSTLLAMMSCARVCPLKTRRSLKTIRNTRFQARRCDCSFVVAYLTALLQNHARRMWCMSLNRRWHFKGRGALHRTSLWCHVSATPTAAVDSVPRSAF